MKTIHVSRLLARALGLHALAWKLRKLDFAIRRDDLVLDAGSGAAPNPFANVVVDYDPSGRETLLGSARDLGKTLVWADLQRLPFRDGVFDYALCFHVLEHVVDARAALGELQRVAKAGYIETPNEIFDILVPYPDHRNRVSYDGQTLRVYRKARWNVERFEERFGQRRVDEVYSLLARNPEHLHVQYYWRGRISAEVPDELIEDGVSIDSMRPRSEGGGEARLNALVSRVLRRRRLSDQELLGLVRCIDCRSEDLALDAEGAVCRSCSRRYPRLQGFLDFRP